MVDPDLSPVAAGAFEVGPSQRALGARLRSLRESLPGKGDRATTQAEMASLLFVGGKPAISLMESGKRLPDDSTIDRYAAVCGTDPGELAALLAAATSERQAGRDALTAAASSTAPHSESGRSPQTGAEAAVATTGAPSEGTAVRRRVLWAGAAAAVVAAAAVTAVIVWPVHDARESQRASISRPQQTTAATTPVDGTITGWSGDDLWIDVQSVAETRHHTTDTPCTRSGDTFAFDPLFVGRPADVGVTFRVSIVAAPRGSSADAALIAYGRRDKSAVGAYDGLDALPVGSQVITTALVVRQ